MRAFLLAAALTLTTGPLAIAADAAWQTDLEAAREAAAAAGKPILVYVDDPH